MSPYDKTYSSEREYTGPSSAAQQEKWPVSYILDELFGQNVQANGGFRGMMEE
jgi:hypothetical protein